MKYILTNEVRKVKPRKGKQVVLYRIRATRNFTTYSFKRKIRFKDDKRTIVYEIEEKLVKAGDPGGFVQSEKNLSQKGSCWIDDEAYAFGSAVVRDDAYLGGKARIGDNVKLLDNTKVVDNIQLGGNNKLTGRSKAIGEGIYYDNGTYNNVCLGKIEVKAPSEKTNKKSKDPSNSSGKIKIEIQLGGKKIVNDFEF